MTYPVDHTNLHRTAKYFMDTGCAASADAALDMLHRFGLTIHVGPDIETSIDRQVALLTLVNTARRTLLGGVHVIGLEAYPSRTSLAPGQTLTDAVHGLGGVCVPSANADWPAAIIGQGAEVLSPAIWRLTWDGWRAGVAPGRDGFRLPEGMSISLAPALAAAICAAEAFAYHAADHPMAGRRAVGLSLWQPGRDWSVPDASEPTLTYLPSRLWLIGLGNLGQAYSWLIGSLPYRDPSKVEIVLQDFDRIAASNESTSLLSVVADIGKRKARVVAAWLDARSFETILNERPFGKSTARMPEQPGVALCGVDNAQARAALEDAGFGLIVEAGLGAGPQAFRSIALHTFPASRAAAAVWRSTGDTQTDFVEDLPAYRALKQNGMDRCGLAQLASRTVAVPFVGLIAASLVVSELLRRLNGREGLELASCSAMAIGDIETVPIPVAPYAFGHVNALP